MRAVVRASAVNVPSLTVLTLSVALAPRSISLPLTTDPLVLM